MRRLEAARRILFTTTASALISILVSRWLDGFDQLPALVHLVLTVSVTMAIFLLIALGAVL